MKILLATSEAVPFAKTGGLADVCGALPVALERLGQQPAVIMPLYRQVRYSGAPITPLGIEFIVAVGSKTVAGRLAESRLPGSNVPVYLVEQDQYFDRDELYSVGRDDYPDNCERFIFFCRAAVEAIRLLDLRVDVVHANDWQTGLIPAYLKLEYRLLPRYRDIASLMTIHNISFQGQFWHWDMLLTGLDWKHFNWHEMEFFGKLNLLKTGLVYADSVSTVSPRYAEEIQTPQFGCGLEGVLQYRRNVLKGILNGIDPEEWNPATDPHLPAKYTADTVAEGKPRCKAALQAEMGLPVRADVPVIGMITRLTEQKGVDMVAELMADWVLRRDVQWVILGRGDVKYHRIFERLAQLHPQRVAARIDFSTPLAHRIEAGSDMFLMPSRFEPCGLNQMYSLRYGTPPIVRQTGGLADTVADATPTSLADGTGNGFSFREDNTQALGESLEEACDAWHRAEIWSKLIQNGMRQDCSWDRSARQYVDLYQSTVARMREAALVPGP